MQFNVIVGNPPYQGGDLDHATYKSLWPLFWKKCIELCGPAGFVYLVTPTTWCSPTGDLAQRDSINGETRLWNVFEKYTSHANVTTIKKHFPGVGSTFGTVSVDLSGSDGLHFSDGQSSSLGFYPFSGADEVNSQLSKTNNLSERHHITNKTNSPYRVSVFKSRKVCEENVEIVKNGHQPLTGANPTLYVNILVNTESEAIHVRNRVLECRDILNKHCRYNGFIDIKILGMISN